MEDRSRKEDVKPCIPRRGGENPIIEVMNTRGGGARGDPERSCWGNVMRGQVRRKGVETKKMKRGWEDPALKVGRGSAPKKARTTTETTMDGQRRDLTGVGWEKSQW